MESFLSEIGEFGPYQRRTFLLLSLPTIFVALQKFAWVFLGAKVKHRCRLPWENDNATYQLPDDVLETSFPRTSTNEYDQCHMYRNITDDVADWSTDNSQEMVQCSSFIYDTSKYQTSAVIDFDLVCDRSWLRAMVQSVFMVGMLIGSFGFGDLSDRVGRKPVFLFATALMLVVGIGQAAVKNYYVFTLIRFCLGASLQGIFLIAYVIMMEMVGKNKRAVVGILAHIFYSFAYFIGAGVAYFITSWRWLQVAFTLPVVAFAPYFWIIHESARWLSTKGKVEEAKIILKKAADVNKKEVSEVLLQTAAASPTGSVDGNFLDLFRRRSLRLKTVVVFFIWMVNSGVYYGLSLNTSNLGGNDYLNFLISGAVEIPGILFAVFTLDRIGRKTLLCLLMIIGGTALLGGIFLTKETTLLIVLAMCGKMCITTSYIIIYVFTTESFPTVVRNVAVGSSSMVARIGGAVAPFINLLGETWEALPYLIFGGLSVTAGILALTLEETTGRPMADIIKEKKDSQQLSNVTIEVDNKI